MIRCDRGNSRSGVRIARNLAAQYGASRWCTPSRSPARPTSPAGRGSAAPGAAVSVVLRW